MRLTCIFLNLKHDTIISYAINASLFVTFTLPDNAFFQVKKKTNKESSMQTVKNDDSPVYQSKNTKWQENEN